MASAAIPAMVNLFMRTSLERCLRMSALNAAINLQFGQGALCYQDVICESFLIGISRSKTRHPPSDQVRGHAVAKYAISNHSQQARQPQRDFRDVGNQPEKHQHGA